jgi:pimeloyl-ACP methyl ester carboxylesterase
MRILKKVFKVLILIVVSIVILSSLWWFWPERTPSIKSQNNNSIASIEYIKIGDVEQCVLIRGHNTNNPILLFLHGGPGMPMMYMSHEFQRPLEKDFTVVQWDRRGAGKTYSRNVPSPESINVRQIIDDTYELIDTLKARYNQHKIILIGHSFGTYLGSIMVNERPELFSTYISIGQVVDSDKSIILQEVFIREKASLNNREDIIIELNNPNKPNFENWLFEFGGELKSSKSYFPLIWSGMQAPEYTLSEVLDVAKASSFSSSNMKYNVLSNSIYYEIREYQIPTYFMVGKSDYTTPHELISEYFDLIEVPRKELIYFENSAHFPFFEEPEKFCSELKRILLNKN